MYLCGVPVLKNQYLVLEIFSNCPGRFAWKTRMILAKNIAIDKKCYLNICQACQWLKSDTNVDSAADFSSTAEELANRVESDLAKELGCVMGGSFDSDLFPSDDCLREGLVPIDFDGLQMLTDPSEIITDPNAEEHFRLDRIQ